MNNKAKQLEFRLMNLNKQAQQLLALLNREKQALSQDDFEGLLTIIQEKKQCQSLVSECTENLFSEVGFRGGQFANTLQNYMIQTLGNPKHELFQFWQKICMLLNDCANLNKINGAVIQASLHQVQMRLDIVNNNNKACLTYDAKGKTLFR